MFFAKYLRYGFLSWKQKVGKAKLLDMKLAFGENSSRLNIDSILTYHLAWAARMLKQINPKVHYDISSELLFAMIISAFFPVKYYEYRQVKLNIPNLETGQANLINLPFEDNSIESLSCLHVMEHLGLGRYGDPIDPVAHIKGFKELARVIRPGGHLLLAVPMGAPRIRFNAHRVFSRSDVEQHFNLFSISEFYFIPDCPSQVIDSLDNDFIGKQKFGCGCYCFKKKVS